MAVRIASNISSLTSQRRLGEATRDLSKVSERLSSGLRINKAADDAAGLQIAEGLKSDAKVFGQAIRNANDSLSLLDIAQGATEQLSAIVTRQAELAEQAANGTLGYKQRLALNSEANALVREYNRIVQTTSFNGINTLTGLTSALRAQLGYGTNGGINFGVGNNIGFAAGDGQFGGSTSATQEITDLSFSNALIPGQQQIITIQFQNAASFALGSNITLENGLGTTYLFWTNIDGLESPPPIDAGITYVEVYLNSGWDADAVATALGNAIGGVTGGTVFSTHLAGDSIEVTNVNVGQASYADNTNGGVRLITEYTVGTDAQVSYSSGDYFTLNDGATQHYFWFNYQGGGVDPAVGGVGHQLAINSATTAANISSMIAAILSGIPTFSAADHSGSLTVTNVNAGVAADATFVAGSGGFSASVVQQGAAVSASSPTYATGGSSNEASLGDFNGDGIIDIVSADTGGVVSLFLGSSDGTFLPRRSFVAGTTIQSVRSADLDGDGILDLLASDIPGFGAVSILLGNGDGTFRAKQSYATGTGTLYVNSADFNGDGIADIYATIGSAVSVLLGNGNGTFLARQTYASPQAVSLASADFNGDGILDLMTADFSLTSVGVFLGNGDGTFLARKSYTSGSLVTAAKAGDFNNDGILDIATVDSLGTSSSVSILFGNGNGTFQARITYALTGSSGASLELADFNGDGVLDLGVGFGGVATRVDVLLGNSNGTFSARQSFAVTAGARSISVGDFNGDGVADIAAVGGASANILIGHSDSSGRRNNRLAALDLSTKYGAKQALTASKAALTRITSELGSLGAIQSRLSSATQTLLTSRENYDAARSQLVDADIAQESALLVSTNIKQQAATAVLAQANNQPQLSLKLLGVR